MLKTAPPSVLTRGGAWRATLALDTARSNKSGGKLHIEGVSLPGEASKPQGPLSLSLSRAGLSAAAAGTDLPPKMPGIGDICRVCQPDVQILK